MASSAKVVPLPVSATPESANDTTPVKSNASRGKRKAGLIMVPKEEVTNQSTSGKNSGASAIPLSERQSLPMAMRASSYIKAHKGRFLRDEAGGYHILLNGVRIPLNNEKDNVALNGFMLKATSVTTVTQAARAAIARLQVKASKSAESLKLRRFSALSADHTCLYVPLSDGGLLKVSAEDIKRVENGNSTDGIWLEHPKGKGSALKYSEVDAQDALRFFEKCVVEPQACTEPSMKWLTAMEEGLFPYLRETCGNRFITAHRGGAGDGKTTGARWFTSLHGLGDVKGDYSVAAIRNGGDSGLIVLDNLEHSNMGALTDTLLYMATGAESGRSSVDGVNCRTNDLRPVMVITSIEGAYKPEIQRRIVDVDYAASALGDDAKKLYDPDANRVQLESHRDEIRSGLMKVIQQFFRDRDERAASEIPRKLVDFSENFHVLARLLRAYGRVMGRPEEWANEIIREWKRVMDGAETEEDELQVCVLRVLKAAEPKSKGCRIPGDNVEGIVCVEGSWQDRTGSFFAVNATSLFELLQADRTIRAENVLPRTPNALGKRLKFNGPDVYFVPEDQVPQEYRAQLKRTSQRRCSVLFVPNGEE